MPTCNGASHLEECLASIRAQTFADFEVIIVDDASDDASAAIAKKFAAADARFQVHANPRRLGLVGNFNSGRSKSSWDTSLIHSPRANCMPQLKFPTSPSRAGLA